MKYKIIFTYLFLFFTLFNLRSNDFQIAKNIVNQINSDKKNYIIDDFNYKILISIDGGNIKVFKLSNQIGEVKLNLDEYDYIENIYYIINKNDLFLFLTSRFTDGVVSFLIKVNLNEFKVKWNYRIPCLIRTSFIIEGDYLYFVSSVGTGKINIITGDRIWNIGNENWIKDKNNIFNWRNFDRIFDMKLEGNKLLYYRTKDILNFDLVLFFTLNKENGELIK